jgi:hypothetical protein
VLQIHYGDPTQHLGDAQFNTYGSRWVFTVKEDDEGRSFLKARLVAQGFDEEVDHHLDAPTASRDAARIVTYTAAQRRWKLHAADVKT